MSDVRRDYCGKGAPDAAPLPVFEDDAVGDEGEVGKEQGAARENQREPITDFEIEIDAQADVDRGQQSHTDGRDEGAEVPGEDSGGEAQEHDEIEIGGGRRLLDEATEDEGVGDVPVAAGQ